MLLFFAFCGCNRTEEEVSPILGMLRYVVSKLKSLVSLDSRRCVPVCGQPHPLLRSGGDRGPALPGRPARRYLCYPRQGLASLSCNAIMLDYRRYFVLCSQVLSSNSYSRSQKACLESILNSLKYSWRYLTLWCLASFDDTSNANRNTIVRGLIDAKINTAVGFFTHTCFKENDSC